MKNKEIKPVWFWISHVLVIVWMIVIFSFSAQPGEESADLSGGVSHLVMTLWNQIFGLGWDEAKVLAMTELWDFPIRKLAHMTEFGILAMLIFVATKSYVKIKTIKHRYIIAWLVAVCYAGTDEFHQLFVPGRSGNLFDVCVDATGITSALFLIFGAKYVLQKCNLEIRKRESCGRIR